MWIGLSNHGQNYCKTICMVRVYGFKEFESRKGELPGFSYNAFLWPYFLNFVEKKF